MERITPVNLYPPTPAKHAFSLIELLVVIAVIGVLVALVVPAFTTITRARAISDSANLVIDNLRAAQQSALAQNRLFEVRFYQTADDIGTGDVFRTLRLLRYDEAGTVATPESKLQTFPQGAIIADETSLSTILAGPLETESVSGQPDRKYHAVGFTPAGSTTLALNQRWFLTVLPNNSPAAAGEPPANFATVQVDPFNGNVTLYRP